MNDAEKKPLGKKDDYNNVPVYYCNKCLSLKVINYTGPLSCYCGNCSSLDIKTAHISEWEKLVEEKRKSN